MAARHRVPPISPQTLDGPKGLKTLATTLTGEDLKAIDTSLIEDMQSLFFNNSSFNGKINCWDTSNVSNMFGTFRAADAFNQNIGDWDVSKVTNMENMFLSIDNFNNGDNASIGNWDVSNVINMNTMFIGAKVFNQNLSGWNVSKVAQRFDFASFTPAWTNNAHLPHPSWPNS